MKQKVSISDTVVEDVVTTMAESLGVGYEQNYHEYRLELPEQFGRGQVTSYTFSDGLGVVRTSYVLKKDFHFDLQKGVVHPLKISFNLGDPYFHKLERDDDYTEIGHLQTLVTSSIPTNNHRYMIPAKTESRIFTIEINREKFDRKTVDFQHTMPEGMAQLFRDIKGVMPFLYIAPYSHDIAETIERFIHNKYSGFMRKAYQEGKVLEILAAFLDQYTDDQQTNGDKKVLRSDHMRRIRTAVDYLKANLDEPIPIGELAKKVGLNQNILQKGFQAINGMTVHEFENKLRMDEAYRLIMETDLSVSEITHKIGINSKSYFSKLFRERFGETPTMYRNKYRSTKGTA